VTAVLTQHPGTMTIVGFDMFAGMKLNELMQKVSAHKTPTLRARVCDYIHR